MNADPIRIGLIGMGNAARMHLAALAQQPAPRAVLTAVCSHRPLAEDLARDLGRAVHFFSDYQSLLRSGSCDAVVICTPHTQHPEQGIMALHTGHHVLCEKPMGSSICDARRLAAAATASDRVFSLNYPKRRDESYQVLRNLVHSRDLGSLYRYAWTATNWYRSTAYYTGSSWRGTWAGEGGGVLLNQAIHNLDLMHDLFGPPTRVRGFCGFGKHHPIEVEDEVMAYLEYADGTRGVFITSTGESPGLDRLEIFGAKGRLIVENHRLTIHKTNVNLDAFIGSYGTGSDGISHAEHSIACAIPVGVSFLAPQQDFFDAILNKLPVTVDVTAGLASLEVANAIVLSTWLDQWIDLPVAGEQFEAELCKRMASGKRAAGASGQAAMKR